MQNNIKEPDESPSGPNQSMVTAASAPEDAISQQIPKINMTTTTTTMNSEPVAPSKNLTGVAKREYFKKLNAERIKKKKAETVAQHQQGNLIGSTTIVVNDQFDVVQEKEYNPIPIEPTPIREARLERIKKVEAPQSRSTIIRKAANRIDNLFLYRSVKRSKIRGSPGVDPDSPEMHNMSYKRRRKELDLKTPDHNILNNRFTEDNLKWWHLELWKKTEDVDLMQKQLRTIFLPTFADWTIYTKFHLKTENWDYTWLKECQHIGNFSLNDINEAQRLLQRNPIQLDVEYEDEDVLHDLSEWMSTAVSALRYYKLNTSDPVKWSRAFMNIVKLSRDTSEIFSEKWDQTIEELSSIPERCLEDNLNPKRCNFEDEDNDNELNKKPKIDENSKQDTKKNLINEHEEGDDIEISKNTQQVKLPNEDLFYFENWDGMIIALKGSREIRCGPTDLNFRLELKRAMVPFYCEADSVELKKKRAELVRVEQNGLGLGVTGTGFLDRIKTDEELNQQNQEDPDCPIPIQDMPENPSVIIIKGEGNCGAFLDIYRSLSLKCFRNNIKYNTPNTERTSPAKHSLPIIYSCIPFLGCENLHCNVYTKTSQEETLKREDDNPSKNNEEQDCDQKVCDQIVAQEYKTYNHLVISGILFPTQIDKLLFGATSAPNFLAETQTEHSSRSLSSRTLGILRRIRYVAPDNDSIDRVHYNIELARVKRPSPTKNEF